MTAPRHTPGPAAAEAFTLGMAVAMTSTLAGVGWFLWAGVLTTTGALAAIALGLPIVLLVVACLLSVWLGYDKDAVDVALS